MKSKIVLLQIYLIVIFLVSCNKHQSKTYTILLDSLPEKINPIENLVNTYHYINMQIYYPLISMDENGKLMSHFLDMSTTKSINLNFDKYLFCLKNNIQFSNKALISNKDLLNTLLRLKKQKIELNIESIDFDKQNCLKVNLKKSDYLFLDRFQTVDSTILSSESKKEYPIGLGPYEIISLDSNEIVLQAINITGNIRTVKFIKYNKDKHNISYLNNISDLNQIRSFIIPDDINKNRTRIEQLANKTYFLFVKLKNKKRREVLYKCIDGYVLALNLNLNLMKQNDYLPKGFINKEYIQKTIIQCSNNQTIRVLTPSESWSNGFKKYFEQSKISNFNISQVSVSEYYKLLFSKKEFIAVVAADATGDQVQDFFEPFKKEKHAVFDPIPEIEILLKDLPGIVNKEQKSELLSTINDGLLKSYYVIPMGQAKVESYFPTNINQIIWQERSTAYPNISKMSID